MTDTKPHSIRLSGISPANLIAPDRRKFRILMLLLLSLLPIFALGFATTAVDSSGIKYFTVISIYQGKQPLTIRVLEPTNPAPGKPHRFLYVLPVEQGLTDRQNTWGDGLEELRLLDVHNRFNMTLIAPSFNYEPWYGDNVSDPAMRMESFVINDLVPFADTFAHGDENPQRFLIGFSKSGTGALSLLLRHPEVFSAAAVWDSPVQQSGLSDFSGLPVNFGTQANYNRYEIPSLVKNNAQPFQQQNRLWLSGDQSAWTPDMYKLHNQLIAASIPHTWTTGGFRVHTWNSGWLEGAVASLDLNQAASHATGVDSQRTAAHELGNGSLTFRQGTRFRLWWRSLRRYVGRERLMLWDQLQGW